MNDLKIKQTSIQRDNGIVKQLFFVTSIDNSLIGKEICGYVLDKVYLNNVNNNEEKTKVAKWALNSFNDYPYDFAGARGSFVHIDNIGEYCLYFIKKIDELQCDNDANTLMRIMSIYKDSAISFSDVFNIRVGGVGNFGRVIHPDKIGNNMCENEHGAFGLNDKEINELESYYNQLLSINNKSEIDKMLDVYMIARRTYVNGVKIVLYVTVLEMLLSKNSEITYRLSRTIAVLLGKTKDDSNEIFKDMKDIYNARSKYVHSGATEKKAYKYVAKIKNYSRKTLLKLIGISSLTGKTIKEIEEETTGLGFGESSNLLNQAKTQ